MFFKKKKKPLGYTIGDLDGFGEISFICDLPKQDKPLVKTVEPKDRVSKPYANPSAGYTMGYWSQSRSSFNQDLYLRVLKSKN
jgi:hypothetical protein